MPEIELALPPLHPIQLEIAQSTSRFKVACLGRRTGKSKVGSVMTAVEAIRGGRAWWIAPTYRVGQVGWRDLVALLSQIPGTEIDKGDLTVRVTATGGEVSVRTADDPHKLRGDGLDFVLFDEAAYQPLGIVWTDVIRPALADKRGRAAFFSTPNGKDKFWELWTRGNDPAFTDWRSWHAPTSANPFIELQEIEDARADMTEIAFRQEFLAEFLDSGLSVFGGFEDCMVDGGLEEPRSGARYVLGVDLGRALDFTVLFLVDVQRRRVVGFWRFNGLPWAEQRRRIVETALRYAPCRVYADATGVGDAVVEELSNSPINVRPVVITSGRNVTETGVPRNVLIERLAVTFQRKEMFLPRCPELEPFFVELQAFRFATRKSGGTSYEVPSGFHDDCTLAAALANFGLEEGTGYDLSDGAFRPTGAESPGYATSSDLMGAF